MSLQSPRFPQRIFFFGGGYSTQAPVYAELGPGLIASVMDPPLMSVRAAGIPRASALAVTETVPLTSVLPVMAVAILSVWAVHCTPEASLVHESAPKASPVHVSTPVPPEVAASAAEPPEEVASTAEPPEVAASAAEPPEVGLLNSLSVMSRPQKPFMNSESALSQPKRSVHELRVCPVTAKEAVHELRVCPDMAAVNLSVFSVSVPPDPPWWIPAVMWW